MATHDRDEQSFSQADALRAAGASQAAEQEVQAMRANLRLANERMNRLLTSIADGLFARGAGRAEIARPPPPRALRVSLE